MDRFKGGLFGGGSPAHDELVLMTIDKRDDIIHRILPKILRYRRKPNIENVFFCPKSESPRWCTSDFQTEVFSVEPVCLKAVESHPYNLVDSSVGELKLPRKLRLCRETTWVRDNSTPEEICDMINEVCGPVEPLLDYIVRYWGEIHFNPDLDEKCIQAIVPNNIHKIVYPIPVLESYEVDWETKKICKRDTGFFLGCADIVFDFELKIRNDIIPNDIETWRGLSQDFNLRLVAQTDPKLTSWGVTHGELKVFMDNLKKRHSPNTLPITGIVPTFSKAPLEVHKTLEKDNIHIVRFTKKGEISDGVEPGQTRL